MMTAISIISSFSRSKPAVVKPRVQNSGRYAIVTPGDFLVLKSKNDFSTYVYYVQRGGTLAMIARNALGFSK